MNAGANLQSFVRRFWPLLIATGALIALVSASLGGGSSATHSAQAAERRPHASPTPTASVQTAAEDTEGMPESVKEALAAYLDADSRFKGEHGPVEIENHLHEMYLPLILGRGFVPPPRPTPVPVPTDEPEPEDEAYVTVTIWPNPNIRVARDGIQAYEVRVTNHGDGGADSVRVRLPYNKGQMTITDSRFGTRKDWVSSVTDSQVTITFGELDAKEARSGTIFMKVNKYLADNTVLPMRASFTWDDASDGGDGASNWAPILVGSGNDSAPWVWASVDPAQAYPGQIFRFYSDRFTPHENIVTWLNTPSGVKSLTLRGNADQYGRIWLNFNSEGLRPGTYQLVMYGTQSKLTGIRTFTIW